MRFLFYDRILEMEPGKRALASKIVSLGEKFLPDQCSRRSVMPVSLTLECLAQVAGWLYIVTEQFTIRTVPGLIQGVEVRGLVRPGDILRLEVWIQQMHRAGAALRGEAHIGNTLILSVERLTFASDRQTDRAYAETTRRLFDCMSGGYQLDGGPRRG